jgi:hypothetical protein
MKKTSFFSIVSSILLTTTLAFSAGKIQNEDVKSVSDLTGAGSNATHLINDDKIWVKALGINLTFDDAILNQSLFNGISTTTRNAIASPVTNQTIYNITNFQFETWNGSAWVLLPQDNISSNNTDTLTLTTPALTADTGPLVISTGNAAVHSAGNITIQPGQSNSGNPSAGSTTISGGQNAAATGGTMLVTTATQANLGINSGPVFVTTGGAIGTGATGDINLSTGLPSSGLRGSILLDGNLIDYFNGLTQIKPTYTSNSEGGDPGTFIGNNSGNDQTNRLVYFGSTDTTTNSFSTSDVYIAAGDLLGSAPTGNAGSVSLVAGGVANTGGIAGGTASINGGNANDGQGGDIRLNGGSSSSGNAGGITLTGGTSDTNSGGSVSIRGGHTNGGNQNGGNVSIQGGSVAGSGFAGAVSLESGDPGTGGTSGVQILTHNVSNSGQVSGDIQIQTGAGQDTGSGNLQFYTGNLLTGPTGGINLVTGSAITSGDSGPILLQSGIATGGSRGTITLDSSLASIKSELRLDGSTSGYVGLLSPAAPTSYSLILPGAQGTGALTDDGTGNLSWVVGGGGATIALDNLASTAVNADINPGVAGTVNLGTPSLYYNNVEGSTLQARSQVLLSDFATPAQIRLSVVGTIPSGQSVPRIHTDAFDTSVDADSLAVFTESEPTADAEATGNLYLETGNKVAGTGNSGNIIIQPGTSFGGSPGNILFGQTATPTTNGTFNLGSPTFGFNTIYAETISSHTTPKGIVDLGNSQLYQSPANELILDWGVGRLFGNVSGSPEKSIDWNTRQIFKNDGSTVLLDWSGNEIHIKPELRLDGSSSGYVGQKSPSAPTSYTVTWPTTQGGPNTSLVNDGSGNLFWASPGSGPATVSFISSQVTTDSAAITGSSFVTFSNSPALTITPTIGGTYAVYSPISVDQQTSAITGTTRIFNTSGGATVIGESDGVIYFQTAPGEATAYSETDYTLTAGVTYQFDIQGKNTGTGSLLAVGIEGPFYMFARLISANNTVPVTMAVGLTTAYTPGANAPIIYDTVLDDSNSGYSTGTGLYTVPHTASYLITLSAYTTTSASTLRVAVNGVPLQYITGMPNGAQVYGGSTTVKCNAGDTIAIWSSTNVEFFGQAPQYVNYLSIDEVH